MASRCFRIAVIICCFLSFAAAQVPTPHIDSLQSSTSIELPGPDHGNAITSGTPLDLFYLWINGNFNPSALSYVQWFNPVTNQTYTCQVDSNCYLDFTTTRIRVSIPSTLYSTLVFSQIAVQITVVEGGRTAPLISNVANFFINPQPFAAFLPNGFKGVPYTQSLIGGGTAPFTLKSWGTLPPGLSLKVDDPVLRGTPTTSGFYEIIFDLTDDWGLNVNATSNLRVLDPITITGLNPSSRAAGLPDFTLTVTGTGFQAFVGDGVPSRVVFGGQVLTTTVVSPTTLQANVPANLVTNPGLIPVLVRTSFFPDSNTVNFTVLPPTTVTNLNPNFTLSGGPAFNLAVNGTNFPNPTTIVFNGTPLTTTYVNTTQVTTVVPANLIVTPATVNVTVTNTFGTFGPLAFTIRPQLRITTSALPGGTIGVNYNFPITAIGGNGAYAWSATGLPDGITINAGTGVISGNPRSSGTFTPTITVRDALTQVVSVQYPLVVVAPTPPLDILGSFPNGVVGVRYEAGVSGTGGSSQGYGFSVSGGSLPPGLGMTSSGVIAGTPTTVGTFRFIITLSDSAGASASRNFAIEILPAPLTITGAVSDTPLGNPLSVAFGATGGVAPYTFAVSGSIPPGTQFSGGTLAGTPNSLGTFEFTVSARDSAGTVATKTFTIRVTAPPLQLTGNAGNGEVGAAYSAAFSASGGVPPYAFSASGLPAGVQLSGSNLTGTPTADGTFPVSITVTDSAGGRVTRSFSVVISVPPVRILTTSLPNGTVGEPYSGSLAATGGIGPYTWSVSGTPDGVNASSAGSLSGTPLRQGTFPVNATVTDSKGNKASSTFNVSIAAPPLVITTSSLPNPVLGSAYGGSVAATGGVQPYTWSGSQLPPGISLSTGGIFSGSATATGPFSIQVSVLDSQGNSTSRTFPVTVVIPPVPPVNVTGLPPTSNPGTQPNFQFVLGEPYPVTVTVTATLTFVPDAGPDDPSVQFSGGGRTTTLNIPAGSTTSPNVPIQTGTVAGTVTITFRLAALSNDVTPTPVPTRTVRITPAPPVITSVTASRNASGFTVTVAGYASSREITQALFTFAGAPGSNLQTTQISAPVETLFSQWFGSTASAPFGSQFLLTWSFTVQGDTSSIASVSVTLVNRLGNSNAVSANLQ